MVVDTDLSKSKLNSGKFGHCRFFFFFAIKLRPVCKATFNGVSSPLPRTWGHLLPQLLCSFHLLIWIFIGCICWSVLPFFSSFFLSTGVRAERLRQEQRHLVLRRTLAMTLEPRFFRADVCSLRGALLFPRDILPGRLIPPPHAVPELDRNAAVINCRPPNSSKLMDFSPHTTLLQLRINQRRRVRVLCKHRARLFFLTRRLEIAKFRCVLACNLLTRCDAFQAAEENKYRGKNY